MVANFAITNSANDQLSTAEKKLKGSKGNAEPSTSASHPMYTHPESYLVGMRFLLGLLQSNRALDEGGESHSSPKNPEKDGKGKSVQRVREETAHTLLEYHIYKSFLSLTALLSQGRAAASFTEQEKDCVQRMCIWIKEHTSLRRSKSLHLLKDQLEKMFHFHGRVVKDHCMFCQKPAKDSSQFLLLNCEEVS